MSNTKTPKIAVCFITQNRERLSKECLTKAKENAGIDCHFFGLDQGSTDNVFNQVEPITEAYIKLEKNIGVASGFNRLWNLAYHSGYDFIATIGNDINLPKDWLREFYETFQAVGFEYQLSAIHSVEVLPDKFETIKGKRVHWSSTIFGCIFFKSSLLDHVGYFNTDYNPYGLEDSEYSYRAEKLGVKKYYLGIGTAKHEGEPYGKDDSGDYRKTKDASLSKNMPIYQSSLSEMDRTKCYYKPYAQ